MTFRFIDHLVAEEHAAAMFDCRRQCGSQRNDAYVGRMRRRSHEAVAVNCQELAANRYREPPCGPLRFVNYVGSSHDHVVSVYSREHACSGSIGTIPLIVKNGQHRPDGLENVGRSAVVPPSLLHRHATIVPDIRGPQLPHRLRQRPQWRKAGVTS
jgi:hypothetical protein